MGSMRRRPLAMVMAIALVFTAAACGNSDSEAKPTTTTVGSDTNSGTGATQPGKKVAVDAPGVSDTEIKVGGVASVDNPLGGRYGDAFEGVQAYFDMINADG